MHGEYSQVDVGVMGNHDDRNPRIKEFIGIGVVVISYFEEL